MNTYKITINDGFFPHNLTGEFSGITKEAAIKECKEFYAYELDTIAEEIKIISIEQAN